MYIFADLDAVVTRQVLPIQGAADYNYFSLGNLSILPKIIEGTYDINIKDLVTNYKKHTENDNSNVFKKICEEL